jgi:gliding motility-associated-like protein
MELGENVFQWTTSNRGKCTDKDTVSVFVYDIFIPELLTPNGDGDNDVFEIKGISNLKNAELTVFNRWGGKVHYSEHYENNWTGTNKSGQNLTNDTYFYVLNINNGQRVFKGFVILSR